MTDPDFIFNVLATLARHDACDDVTWRADVPTRRVTFWVNCNDFFEWATADTEEVTAETFSEFAKAYEDAARAEADTMCVYGGLLYCARQRKCRPQGAAYRNMPDAIRPLFDACGPARAKDILNPVAR